MLCLHFPHRPHLADTAVPSFQDGPGGSSGDNWHSQCPGKHAVVSGIWPARDFFSDTNLRWKVNENFLQKQRLGTTEELKF